MAKEEALMNNQNEHSGDKPFKIKRGRVDSLSLYEITEHELVILENGSPFSLYLNFSLLLLTTATSFLISLLTITIDSDRTYTTFVILVVVGYVLGILLGIIWWRTRQSVSEITKRIRNRIPPEEQAEAENPTDQESASEGESAANKQNQADA
ncbi:MAG: hypothetical protein ABGX82_15745 [Pseudomonas sp.]|uniref:hypothetical protein n=1 Tax=Pseudomonas sp. TaxID=306 RepID=UPI00324261CC